jgi:1,4-alpha-glucan branching enzyme
MFVVAFGPFLGDKSMLKREATKNGKQVKVTFVVPDNPDHTRISVVGEFKNWDPEATRLIRRANKTRSVSVTLDAGKQYSFRYRTEDGEWFNDEAADGYVDNEHGTQNCLIIT